LTGGCPYDFFSFLVDDNILFKIVTETNRFAAQKITSFKNLSPHSRLRAWYDTDIGEIKTFWVLFYGWALFSYQVMTIIGVHLLYFIQTLDE